MSQCVRFGGLPAVIAMGCLCLCGCGSSKARPAPAAPQANNGPSERPAALAPSSRINHANLDRLRLGMTEKEVAEILGSADTEAAAGGGGNEIVKSWMKGEQFLMLTFAGGKLKSKTADGLPQVPEKLTRANVDQVKIGAGQEAVLEVLGPGKKEHELDATKTITWEDGDKLINVHFVDGKVALKTAQGL